MRLTRWLIATLCALLIAGATPLFAQTSKADEQRRIIAELEASIAKEEKQLARLKKNKASQQKLVNSLIRQIEKRNALINATDRQIKELNKEISASSARIKELSGQHSTLAGACGEMVRTAYRNYRFNNTLTYLLSASSAAEFAARLAALRNATEYRHGQMKNIVSVREDVQREREALDAKRAEAAAAKKRLDRERERLRRDRNEAKKVRDKMTRQEKSVQQSVAEQEKKLDAAIRELRALTKGNKSGSGFSTTTSGLRLPVAGGRVVRYNGNMVEIVGKKGAAVTSIYEGKVMKISRNKINNKYDVYVAHGEYISSYANLASVSVKQGQQVTRNQTLGEVASMVNPTSMEVEYKIVFGIYAPSPSIKMQASSLFK